MTPELAFRASGALLLTGAYALLEPGGMGIALPWPPRIDVSSHEAEHWKLTILDAQGRRTADVSTLAEVAEGALPEFRPQDVTLDFGAYPATSTSAILALAVAREATPSASRKDWSALRGRALALHRTLQGGLGSGYDVLIASLRRAALLERPKADPSLSVPAPLTHRVLAIDGAAGATQGAPRILVGQHSCRVPTRHLLTTYRANRAREPERVSELVTVSQEVARDVARALEEANLALLRAAFAQLGSAQETLQALLDGNYINDSGRAGLRAARELGVAAAPSGAGADTLVALDGDPDRLERLDEKWSALGFHTTRLDEDETGPGSGSR